MTEIISDVVQMRRKRVSTTTEIDVVGEIEGIIQELHRSGVDEHRKKCRRWKTYRPSNLDLIVDIVLSGYSPCHSDKPSS